VIFFAFVLATLTPLEREPAFRSAEAAYNSFEFEDARLKFEKLAMRRGLTNADRARLQLWIGMCHAEEGALDAAVDDFEDAAVLDPEVEALSFMSPKARRMLDEARKRAGARRPPARPDPLPEPEPGPTPTPPTPAPTPTPAPDFRYSPLMVAGTAALGVGGIAAVSSAIAGIAAQDAAAAAVGADDAATATARHQSAQQLALGANVGFVAAAVAAVAGGGLLLAGGIGDD
jgi:hypothetical protein